MKARNPFDHDGCMAQKFSNPCGCALARQGNPCDCKTKSFCCVDPDTMLFVCSDTSDPMHEKAVLSIEDIRDNGTALVMYLDAQGEPQQKDFQLCRSLDESKFQYDAVNGVIVTADPKHRLNDVAADVLAMPTEDYAYVRSQNNECFRLLLHVEELLDVGTCSTGTCPLSSPVDKQEWWAKEGHCCEKCALGLACGGGCGCGGNHKEENPHNDAVWYPAAKGSKRPQNAKYSWVQIVGPRQESGVLRTPGKEPDFKVKVVKLAKAPDGTMKAKIHGIMSNGKVKTVRRVA